MNWVIPATSCKWNYTMFAFLWVAISFSLLSSGFINVVACQIFLSFYGRIHKYILLIHSPVGGHLSCFYLYAIVNCYVHWGINIYSSSESFLWITALNCYPMWYDSQCLLGVILQLDWLSNNHYFPAFVFFSSKIPH
jgi:hypothetical protein